MSFQAGHEAGRTVPTKALTLTRNRSNSRMSELVVTGVPAVEALSDRPSLAPHAISRSPDISNNDLAETRAAGRAPKRRSPAVTYGRESRSDQAESAWRHFPS